MGMNMSTANLNVSTLDAAAISGWLKSKTVSDNTVASFLAGRTVSNAPASDAALSSTTVIVSLNHADGATIKAVSQNARREFLSFIKASCGLPDSAPIDKLPAGVQKAMKCTGFVGLFKKGDWDASNGRPLTARRIKAVMTALEESSFRQTVDEKISRLVGESVQPYIDKGWISRGKFDTLCRRIADRIERNFKRDLPGELEGKRDPGNLDDVSDMVRTFCDIIEDGVAQMYKETEKHCEGAFKTVYPDENIRKTKKDVLRNVANEIKNFATVAAFLQVIKRHPVMAKTWDYDPGRVKFADQRVDRMASTREEAIEGWRDGTSYLFGILEGCLESAMTLMVGGEVQTISV